MVYVLFVVGFVILIKGADMLVEGASSIGKRLGWPPIVIGLTIVSFGTSLPELLVNIFASFSGSSELAIGNVLGSNIANILLILGISAMIKPLPITRNTYFSEIPFSLIATLLVGFLANVTLFNQVAPNAPQYISRYDGFILLFFFAMFLGYVYVVSKQNKDDIQATDIRMMSTGMSVIYIALGSVGLYFGGNWVVGGSIKIATYFGMSESLVGLTIVAIGTSLPELVTSIIATMKNDTDIAVGNAVGSNIFNLLWILGISAVIKPLEFQVVSNSDIFMIIIASTMLILAVIIGKRTAISRWEGLWFFLAYVAYMIFLFKRG
ncbi:MAG: calcium/sodium antiporter [Cyclobacteriaceae bacterium]|nr:calcium/sodium antiporter [Cyclobacteriaceae bacterium]